MLIHPMNSIKHWLTVFACLCFTLTVLVPSKVMAKEPKSTDKVLQVFQQAADKSQAPTLVMEFDMASLKKLPPHTFTTHTPWHQSAVSFTGPLLRDILNTAKVKGHSITAIALDDYKDTLPFSDAMNFDVILAHSLNGEQISMKNKGPLFVVYPYDSKKELQSVRYYQRSVWQLKALIIE